MNARLGQQTLHWLFRLGVGIKGVDGVLETLGGILLLFVSPKALSGTVVLLTAHELSEDPHDWFATALRHSVQHLSSDTELFAAAYLLVHGLIKVFLVAGLLREKLRIFPMALTFIGIFIAYQLYRFTHTHSLILLAFTLFDTFVAWLIWREYQMQKHHALGL
jgi:uncharacterized membrane protein